MLEVIKTVAESVALGTALIIASLDLSGAHAQTITVIRPGGAMPSVVYPSGGGGRNEAVAQRQRDGHFYFDADMGGATVHMVFDTGCGDVALRSEDAEKMGINVDRLRFDRIANTANGQTSYAAVIIPSITVGGITQRNVKGSVGRPGALHVSLLGQTFTSRLAGFKQEGNQLLLQGGE